MIDLEFRVVPLSSDHDKSTRDRFDSGSKPLDDYLKHQATQDIRRKVTSCYVAVAENGAIAGYYTLASASVDIAELPDDLKRKLPRYPSVPAARMGRLAVDLFFQKKGLGAALLADALTRLFQVGEQLAVYALVVDAKNDRAAEFYRHHGFLPLTSRKKALFLPLAVAAKLLS